MYDRMLAGDPYVADDPDIAAASTRAQALSHRYNTMDPTDGAVRRAVLEELLGVDATAERREAVVPLAPGTTVLLHTDGLVERRGSTLDEGSERLHAALADLAGRPLPELCDELLARLLEGTPQDDVAVVALTVSPPPA